MLLPCAVLLAPVLAWLILGRRRYKPPLPDRPDGEGWVRTAECFHDPGSDALITVWYRPGTGERAYARMSGRSLPW